MFKREKSLPLYFLVCVFSFEVNSYGDANFESRMNKIESELLDCFINYDKFSLNDQNQLKQTYEKFKTRFSGMNALIIEIVQPFVNLKTNENLTVDILASRIYETAVRFYLLGSSNKGVAYHNFCHGMAVAFLTNEILRDKKLEPGFIERTYRAILVFSGLFHDVAHPGMSNTIYQINKPHRSKFIAHVSSRFSEILVNINKKLYPEDNNLSDKIDDYKGKNDFILEDLHTDLALYAYMYYLDH